jgi:magnesium chelatase subunit D
MSEASAWADAMLAARLLAVDPAGLGGAVLRGLPGPARDAWLDEFTARLGRAAPVRRAPAGIEDDRLLGGLDLAATLAFGRPVAQAGVIAESDGGALLLPMAERMGEGPARRIASALDRGMVSAEREGLSFSSPARLAIVAFDEGASEEERASATLLDRCAFWIDLAAAPRAPRAASSAPYRPAPVAALAEGVLEALCESAVQLGVASLRAPLLAVRAARAHAGLLGKAQADLDDALVAVRLVLVPRATQLPASEPPPEPDEPPPPPENTEPPELAAEETAQPQQTPPAELLLEAALATLPPGMLEALAAKARQAAKGPKTGAGAAQASPLRGRPAGVRAGRMRPGARLSLLDTLRAAAPWGRLRTPPQGAIVAVRREDFRFRRFVKRAETTVIFAVDASGSAAFQRLAEAKGAVELLLAEAYVARTQVAVIAFRGEKAELLLSPTRSLTRARRSLAGLPGGGGTPLAAGLDAALALAVSERAKGRTPSLVLLTDGRANIARSGAQDRAAAAADAEDAARRLKAEAIASAFIDTGPRPRADNAAFAGAMGARYQPLPYPDAARLGALAKDLSGPAR